MMNICMTNPDSISDDFEIAIHNKKSISSKFQLVMTIEQCYIMFYYLYICKTKYINCHMLHYAIQIFV